MTFITREGFLDQLKKYVVEHGVTPNFVLFPKAHLPSFADVDDWGKNAQTAELLKADAGYEFLAFGCLVLVHNGAKFMVGRVEEYDIGKPDKYATTDRKKPEIR